MLDIKGLLFKSLKRHTEGHIELSDYKYMYLVSNKSRKYM